MSELDLGSGQVSGVCSTSLETRVQTPILK